jgi:hypothetical protein
VVLGGIDRGRLPVVPAGALRLRVSAGGLARTGTGAAARTGRGGADERALLRTASLPAGGVGVTSATGGAELGFPTVSPGAATAGSDAST